MMLIVSITCICGETEMNTYAEPFNHSDNRPMNDSFLRAFL